MTVAELTSVDGLSIITDCLYKRNALSVVSEAFRLFNQLLNTKRFPKESMKNIENRFSAEVTRFNSLSVTTKLPECLTPLLLLSNAHVSGNQRITFLAAATPHNPELNSSSSNDDFLKCVKYSSVSSVVKHRDVEKEPDHALTITASNARHKIRSFNKGKYGKKKALHDLPKAQQEAIILKHPCRLCGKYGRWQRHQNADGSLKLLIFEILTVR